MTSADLGSLVRNLRTDEVGSAFAGFRDAHVHLGLIDRAALADAGLCGVVDLGWSPGIVELAAGTPLHVAYAGRFLAAPGGYPTGRSWAPEGCVNPVADPAEAWTAVGAETALGASVVKVTLHTSAGPVPDRRTLAALVEASTAQGLPLVAHAEGPGAVELSLEAGVGVLAHTPWTESLSAETIALAAASQRWISTLDIHGPDTAELESAVGNLRRFHEAGGEVLYGTDLGNGDRPVGVNPRELELLRRAGLRNRDLIHALTAPFPAPLPEDRVTFVPGLPGHDAVGWLVQATVARPEELVPVA